jgi:hypothetical protein
VYQIWAIVYVAETPPNVMMAISQCTFHIRGIISTHYTDYSMLIMFTYQYIQVSATHVITCLHMDSTHWYIHQHHRCQWVPGLYSDQHMCWSIALSSEDNSGHHHITSVCPTHSPNQPVWYTVTSVYSTVWFQHTLNTIPILAKNTFGGQKHLCSY